MFDKLKNITGKIVKKFKGKKISPLFIIAIVGIILIGLSELYPSGGSKTKNEKQTDTDVNNYIQELEEKTVEMISNIEGAGKCKVMITAETSTEKEFAVNKNDSNDTQNYENQQKKSSDSQTDIVIIQTSGSEQALVTSVKQPKIRGVLVLCEGADNSKTVIDVTQAVKTVLGVPLNKIYVNKLKS